ncbi:MAG TPA: helix-turn-helix domain-containing protein, partial [Ilumatobacteraceae bacterium]|nr:helix-turn-helix domain-containing protein [Ilumatobacteraceae bacterium]
MTNAGALQHAAPNDDRQHTEHGLERKQQLLDAAAELFADRGYAATRVVDICAAAGVAKGLFYWYFPTKGALFAELVRTMRLRLRRAQGAALDPTADAVTRIANGAEASVRFMADHAAY